MNRNMTILTRCRHCGEQISFEGGRDAWPLEIIASDNNNIIYRCKCDFLVIVPLINILAFSNVFGMAKYLNKESKNLIVELFIDGDKLDLIYD